MKLILILFFLNLVPVFASQELVVGCTSKCDLFFKRALDVTSKKLNIEIKMVDLSKNNVQLSEVDALILPGGADINPEYYLPAVEKELQDYTRGLFHLVKFSEEGRRRDPIEFEFLKRYFLDHDLKNLPVLGVCRGMQMLAVSQGIPLYVDIKTEIGIKNRKYLFDKVSMMDEGSLIENLFSGKPFWAFKRHHQGIRIDYFHKNQIRWPNVFLTSYSNSGLIAESLEFTDRPILGVQFHPENDFGHERKKIFSWLLSKAKIRNEERLPQKASR